MSPKDMAPAPAVSLDDLKREYLTLDSKLFTTAAEVYWRQGQLLIQIKTRLKHGAWLRWVLDNLHVGTTQASLRMRIGVLPSPPIFSENRKFDLAQLAAIAEISVSQKLSLDAAADRWQNKPESKLKSDSKPPKNKRAPKPRSEPIPDLGNWRAGQGRKAATSSTAEQMSVPKAFEVLGIDIQRQTITPDSLDILFKGLRQKAHPDKGGADAKFVALTAAYRVLGGVTKH